MATGFSIDALLDTLAERIVAKLKDHLSGVDGSVVSPRLLTVDNAAVYLGRSRDAVQHLIAAGKIPTVRIDRRVYIDVRDLDRLIEYSKLAAV